VAVKDKNNEKSTGLHIIKEWEGQWGAMEGRGWVKGSECWEKGDG